MTTYSYGDQRPHVRIHNMTPKHKLNVLSILCQQHGDVTGGAIGNWYPDDHNSSLFSVHIRKFAPHQIDEAHYEATRKYSNTKVWKRGRPRGSKNRFQRTNENYSQGDNSHSSSEAGNTFSELDKMLGLTSDTSDTSDISPVIVDETTAASTSTFVDAEQFKTLLSQYVTHDQLLDATNAIQKTLEPVYTEHSHAINALRQQINSIETNKPTIVEIKKPGDIETTKLGIQHKNFPKLLNLCNARMPNGKRYVIWLYGPAGTGKSTAAENVAKALSLSFYTNGKLSSEHQILGYKDASGNYHSTQFRQAYENGGIYLADEIDSWYPDATIALNNALANGHMAFPDKLVSRHPDFIFIGAANTTGLGGTHEYVGRMKQDAATNDRFVYLHWDIDSALEQFLCNGNNDWYDRVLYVRHQVAAKLIKGHLVTPRATLFGAGLLASGFSLEETYEMTLKKGMTDAQWDMIKPNF